MKVLKFGGTSLGSPERMQYVAQLINNQHQNLVVLSAVSGTTNALVALSEAYSEKNIDLVQEKLGYFKATYPQYINNLLNTSEGRGKATDYFNQTFDLLSSFEIEGFSDKENKIILAQGELLSTHFMKFYLEEQGLEAILLPALEFMKTKEGEPDLQFVSEKVQSLISENPDNKIFITQGYICRNEAGEIDNLKRGGSDYSASLIGAAITAEEIQIWTDIDGMHNNDPRIVGKTFPVHELSFDEAAELAYFGAKILHPASVLPAQKSNIPVRLLNTMKPEAKGTIITSQTTAKRIKAIAAKDEIIAIKVKSSRMLFAYGFLRKIFEVFEKYKTPIDMITTSEVAVSLTIDEASHLEKIIEELKHFGIVEVDQNLTIVCVVGQFLQSDTGIVVKVLNALENIPIRMISYGGSKNNVSILINKEDKKNALITLNQKLFGLEEN